MVHNVLFIVVDDLRPNIAAHGSKFMVTPHMDALAASGVLFQRAYAQYSLCGPSRTSFGGECSPRLNGPLWSVSQPRKGMVPRA